MPESGLPVVHPGRSAHYWENLQTSYDLRMARKELGKRLESVEALQEDCPGRAAAARAQRPGVRRNEIKRSRRWNPCY